MRRVRSALVRLPLRLLAFNLLLVLLPASGVHYLAVFERQLLAAQERSMVQQGRLLAATLAARPDVAVEDVERILVSLDRRTTARLRVLNGEGWLVADSSRFGPRRPSGGGGEVVVSAPVVASPVDARDTRLYRLGAAVYNSLTSMVLGSRPTLEPAEERFDPDGPFDGFEIREALAGRYGAAYRATPGQRSVTLYSALPIVVDSGRVAGVVLVSQSTLRILQDLYEVRLAVLRVSLAALALAFVLSIVVATTVARPLARLATQSLALLDPRGRLRGRFEPSRRRDEIGDLERALFELSRRLAERERFVAAFVADLAHELKNPLASIRAATELGADADDPTERLAMQAIVDREVARLEALLDELREITRLDEEEAQANRQLVDLGAVAEGVVAARLLRDEDVELCLEVTGPVEVWGVGEALARALENLLDNAIGFSPPAGQVRIVLAGAGDVVVLRVEDQGPGIPEEHLDQLFERFFSYRPNGGTSGGSGHSGLGLSIVRRTVERHGGHIVAANRPGGGACFEVHLPVASR